MFYRHSKLIEVCEIHFFPINSDFSTGRSNTKWTSVVFPLTSSFVLDLREKSYNVQFLISPALLQVLHITRLFPSGGVVAQPVERATPGQEVPAFIPDVAARSLGVSIM